jgi:cellulose synthase/poly-beta-1,6-N-acetylglucosamine synthase-like glycosyltransferase
MFILTSFIFCTYFLLLAALRLGWKKAILANSVVAPQESFITVIVPVRNEAESIGSLLQELIAQRYSNFEIIIVDDHSEDPTLQVVGTFESTLVTCITNEGTGKKNAITSGIAIAKGDIITTTDGDCSVPLCWLRSINDQLVDEKTMMLIGGVRINNDGSMFSSIQQIEFSSLIGSAASALALGRPIMCNGANLAYRKQAFTEVGGYTGNVNIPSGDDEFLMRKIWERYSGSIKFHAAPESIVQTDSKKNLNDFLQQRLRWAGKWRFNSSFAAIMLACYILILQLFSLYAYYGIIVGDHWLILLLAIKIFMEAVLLRSFCDFLQIRWNWVAFFSLQILYPLYVIGIGIMSNFSSYIWKGRKYESV